MLETLWPAAKQQQRKLFSQSEGHLFLLKHLWSRRWHHPSTQYWRRGLTSQPKWRWAVPRPNGLAVSSTYIWGTVRFQTQPGHMYHPAFLLSGLSALHPFLTSPHELLWEISHLGFHFRQKPPENYMWEHSASQYLNPFFEQILFFNLVCSIYPSQKKRAKR